MFYTAVKSRQRSHNSTLRTVVSLLSSEARTKLLILWLLDPIEIPNRGSHSQKPRWLGTGVLTKVQLKLHCLKEKVGIDNTIKPNSSMLSSGPYRG